MQAYSQNNEICLLELALLFQQVICGKRTSRKGSIGNTLHFQEGRTVFIESCPPGQNESAQAQNLNGDVIRPTAFPSQFNQLAARLFHIFIVYRVKNFGIAYLSPQTVAADQQQIFWSQRIWLCR